MPHHPLAISDCKKVWATLETESVTGALLLTPLRHLGSSTMISARRQPAQLLSFPKVRVAFPFKKSVFNQPAETSKHTNEHFEPPSPKFGPRVASCCLPLRDPVQTHKHLRRQAHLFHSFKQPAAAWPNTGSANHTDPSRVASDFPDF